MPTKSKKQVAVSAPNFEWAIFTIEGDSPMFQNKFSEKAKAQMAENMEKGSQTKKGKKKPPREFDKEWQQVAHKAKAGWYGLPANGLRDAMIAACRLVGFKMTHAKMSVFVEADGFDKDDDTPLVKIKKGKPSKKMDYVKNATGVIDLRARPKWDPGWRADVRIRYDADQFSLQDVANLLMRAGLQVGIGPGRPFSSNSCGMGWGTFTVAGKKLKKKARRKAA